MHRAKTQSIVWKCNGSIIMWPIVWLYAQLTLENLHWWASGSRLELLKLYSNLSFSALKEVTVASMTWLKTNNEVICLFWIVRQYKLFTACSNMHFLLAEHSNTCELLLHTVPLWRGGVGRYNHTYADFLMPRAWIFLPYYQKEYAAWPSVLPR